MRNLSVRPVGAHVQQLAGHGAIEHQIAMIQSNFFHRLVPPRHALRDAPIADVGLLRRVVRVLRGVDEATGNDARGRVRLTSVEEWQATDVVVLRSAEAVVFELVALPVLYGAGHQPSTRMVGVVASWWAKRRRRTWSRHCGCRVTGVRIQWRGLD